MIYIALFCGGILLIIWVFEVLGKWNDERKAKIRDEVAKQFLANTDINEELIEQYESKLNYIEYDQERKENSFWLSILSDNKKTHKSLVGGKCPECNMGYLTIRKGPHGKFVGCSEYPKCRYAGNLEKALSDYRQQSSEDFMKLFEAAYK